MTLKRNQKMMCMIAALFTVLAFSTAKQPITREEALEVINTGSTLIINIVRFGLNYEKAYGVNSAIIFFLLAYFYYQVSKKVDKQDKRLNRVTLCGSLIFAFFMVFGNSFINLNNWDLVFKSKFQMLISMINYIGYVILFKTLLTSFIMGIKDILKKQVNLKERSKNKENKIWSPIKEIQEAHPILFYMVCFIICWLPYIIIFYPGTLNRDSLLEIEQYLGEIEWTTHHPILPTIIFGTFMKIGVFCLTNDNLGIFFNNIFQIILGTALLSYSMNYIYTLTQSKKIKYGIFIFFAFFPTWPIHFYTEVKDIYFSMSILFYVIFSMKFIIAEGKLNKKQWMTYLVSMILVYLFRNNGVYIVLFSLPFLAIIVKKREKIKIIACSTFAIVLCFSLTQIYTKANNITNGSVREALAIPLQQTARYVMEYELTQEEESTISKLVDIEDIRQNYFPETVDFVKKNFKPSATKEDLKEYFIQWFKMFFKHPNVYLKATMNATYGYYYPDRKEYKDGVAFYDIDTPDYRNVSNFDIHFLSHTEVYRDMMIRATYMLRNMPIIGLLFSCGFYTWGVIVITLILWYFKRKREMVILVPLYTIILVCTASPVNAFVRYMIPVMLTLPFVIGFTTYSIKKYKEAE